MKKKLLLFSLYALLSACTSSEEEATKGVEFYDTNINTSASVVNLGNAVASRTIILKNKSDTHSVANFTLSKGSGFEVVNNCGTGNIQLPANGSCSVVISFNPENVVGQQKVVLTYGNKSIEILATGVGQCAEDNHFDSASSTCISNTRVCSISNGTGTQSYVNGLWGSCQLVSCLSGFENIQNRCRPECGSGYHRDIPPPGYEEDPDRDGEEGVIPPVYTYNCVNNVVACETMPDNALQAVRTWDGSQYGECKITACVFKYHLDSSINSCIYNVRDCSAGNEATGFQQWVNNSWGECTINSCPTNFHIENNLCVSNTRNCVDQTGGTGVETWDQVSWGSCVLDNCLLEGFHVESNQCKPNFRACSLQELAQIPFAVAGKSTWISGTTYQCEIFACSGANMVAFQNQCVDKATAPPMENDVRINNNKLFTNSLSVSLLLGYNPYTMTPPIQMKISNGSSCSGGTWEEFSYDKNWTLLNSNALNSVSVQFKDANVTTTCISKSITHDDIVPKPVLDVDFSSTWLYGNNIVLNMATVGKLKKPYVFNPNQLPDGFRWYMGDETDANLDAIQIAIGTGTTGNKINDAMDWKAAAYTQQPYSGGYSTSFTKVFMDAGTQILSPVFLYDRSYYISLRLIDKAGNVSPVFTSKVSYQLINNYFKTSCNDLLQGDPSLYGQDGIYLIDADGSFLPKEPKAVYCDMTSEGGGWTKIEHELGYKYPGVFTRTTYSQDGSYLNAVCPEGTIYKPVAGRYYSSSGSCSGTNLPTFSSNLMATGGDVLTSRNSLCSYGSGVYPDPDPTKVKDGYLTYQCQSGAAPYAASLQPYRAEDRGCHNAPLVSQEDYDIWACEGGSYNCSTFCHKGECYRLYGGGYQGGINNLQFIVDYMYNQSYYVTHWEYASGDIRGGCKGAYVYAIRVWMAQKTDPWIVIDDNGLENYNKVWINARGASNYASTDPYASTSWKADGWMAKRNLVQLGTGGLNDPSNTWYWDNGASVDIGSFGTQPVDMGTNAGGPYIEKRWGTVSDCRQNGVQYGANGRACLTNMIINTKGQRIKRVSDVESLNRTNWQDNSVDQILNIYVK